MPAKTTTITITLSGPDAEQALAELLSNAQYDALNVTITQLRVTRHPEPNEVYAGDVLYSGAQQRCTCAMNADGSDALPYDADCPQHGED